MPFSAVLKTTYNKSTLDIESEKGVAFDPGVSASVLGSIGLMVSKSRWFFPSWNMPHH